MADAVLQGRAVIPGTARGPALVAREPLSFWGGYDAATGEIIDRSHPLSGQRAVGCILVIPETRGSSTTTAVLLEAIRRGTAPAGFVTRGVDSFLALAAVVAEELYGRAPPVIAMDEVTFDGIEDGVLLTLDPGGRVTGG